MKCQLVNVPEWYDAGIWTAMFQAEVAPEFDGVYFAPNSQATPVEFPEFQPTANVVFTTGSSDWLSELVQSIPTVLRPVLRPEWFSGIAVTQELLNSIASEAASPEDFAATWLAAGTQMMVVNSIRWASPSSDRRPSITPATPASFPDDRKAAILRISNILLGNPVHSAEATALMAGIWQLHDFLDESHHLSQSIEGYGTNRDGDLWHAIMHTREADYSNAKYWFRQVGPHPAMVSLAKITQIMARNSRSTAFIDFSHLMANNGWNANALVDAYQVASRKPQDSMTPHIHDVLLAQMLVALGHTAHNAGL